MHTNTVSVKTLAVLKDLMVDTTLSGFTLVGGTALALQIGHRMSVDIDLFSTTDFDKPVLTKYMTSKHGFRLPVFSDIGIRGFIGNLKTDLMYYENGFIKEPIVIEGIRMAGIEDIALMKLEAIANVQNRAKDYVDIAFLSEHLSLQQMLAGFKEKFGFDETFVLRSLNVFSEVKDIKDVFLMNGKYEWEMIRKRIVAMTNNPSRVFEPMQIKPMQEGGIGL